MEDMNTMFCDILKLELATGLFFTVLLWIIVFMFFIE